MSVNGTSVNFTFQSTSGIVITEIAGIILQGANYKKPTKRVLVMDGDGNRTSSCHTDRIIKTTLKWKISGATLADAIVNTTLQENGAFITITACPSMPELVTADKYEVVDGELSGSNEDVKEISMDIEDAPLIQGVAA